VLKLDKGIVKIEGRSISGRVMASVKYVNSRIAPFDDDA